MGDMGFVRRPSKPVIAYLAQELQDEEQKGAAQPQSTEARSEPTGFIGLDDDASSAELAFRGFMRQG